MSCLVDGALVRADRLQIPHARSIRQLVRELLGGETLVGQRSLCRPPTFHRLHLGERQPVVGDGGSDVGGLAALVVHPLVGLDVQADAGELLPPRRLNASVEVIEARPGPKC